MSADNSKSGRGGARKGAGRKKKQSITASQVSEIDIRATRDGQAPDDIQIEAQSVTGASLEVLVKVMCYATSEAARVMAANEVLDRGYGKPSVGVAGDPMLPFFGTAPVRSVATEIRDKARKEARLALKVLHLIAEHGTKETARVLAAKSLLNRGIGTVAVAKMPDEFAGLRQLGKKEQADRAAEQAGTGRFATPPAPGSKRLQ
jgi:hypothetical protein